jgi:Skp family chaperone for outer membrane proteins
MRTAFIALLTLAIQVATAAAQGDKEKSQPASRVAVVNIGVILDKYEKTREAKEDVWKQIDEAIRSYAESHAITMVLGFSDAADTGKHSLFPNVNRKMNAMDAGGICPLFAAPTTDITQEVLDLLRKEQREKANERVRPSGTDRVALVKVGLVFARFNKAIRLKNELENLARPFNERAKSLVEEIVNWDEAMRARNLDADQRDKLRAKISKNQRALEDLAIEMRRKLGKKHEDDLVLLWTEFQAGVKACSTRDGIELVLGYGDPLTEELIVQFPNISRKKEALNRGFVIPFSASDSVDISDSVVQLLNDPDAKPAVAKEKGSAVRVGALKFDQVFNKYEAAKQFKKELDAVRTPFEEKKAKIADDIKACEAALRRKDLEAATMEEYQDRIRIAKRDLEDLAHDLRKAIDRKQQASLPLLWKQIQACNVAVAQHYGLGIVLGCTGATDNKTLEPKDLKRKAESMEAGGIAILFVAPSLEFSETVADALNLRDHPRKRTNDSK